MDKRLVSKQPTPKTDDGSVASDDAFDEKPPVDRPTTNGTSAFYRVAQIVGDPKRGLPAIVPVSRSTWLDWVRKGKAPAPIKLGPRITVWRARDIQCFIEDAAG